MNTRRIFSAFLVGSTLLLSGLGVRAQVASDMVNTFDTADSIASLYASMGNIDQTNITWDAVTWSINGFQPSSSSGSAKITVNYTGAPNEEFAVCGTWANRWPFDFGTVLDATYYQSLEFIVVVDPNSSPSIASNGKDFGAFQVDLLCTVGGEDWVRVPVGTVSIPWWATNGFRVKIALDETDTNLMVCTGWDIYQKSNADHAGLLTFWMDDLKLIAAPEAPLPQMLIPQKVGLPGLCLSTSTNKCNIYTRQNIYSPALSWVGRSELLTYTFTVTDYPADKPGLEIHLFLIGNGSTPSKDSIVDWNSENLAYLQVLGKSDGSASALFMFKTNVASTVGDRWAGQIFGSNTLASLKSSSVLGTWSLTFQNDTNVTLSAPDGSSTNFLFPADALSCFNDSANNYSLMGIEPLLAGNIGSSVTLSDIKITSGNTVLMDAGVNSGVLDSNWGVAAGDPGGMVVIPQESVYWLRWTLPARNFGLYTTRNLGDFSTWTPVDLPVTTVFDKKAWTILPKSYLDTNGLQTNAYFQLIRQ